MRRSALVALSLFAVPSVATNVAHAEPCPNVIGGEREIDAVDVDTRMRWLDRTLTAESHDAKLWTWGWAAVGLAGIGGNMAWLAADYHYKNRVARVAGATSSFLLMLQSIVNPLRVRYVRVTRDATCGDVQGAERVLQATAKDEGVRHAVLRHVVPIVFAIGGGLVLGLGYGQWRDGAFSAASSVLVSELRIATIPSGAQTGVRRYRYADLDLGPTAWQVAPVALGQEGAGLSLARAW